MNEKKGGMAMSNFVITIGREFGSNGKKIGEEVIVEAPGGEFKLKILSISK